MRRVKTTLQLWALLLASAGIQAQQFETLHLEYLFELCKGKCVLPGASGTFSSGVTSLPLRVDYNEQHEVAHLGVEIIPETMHKALGLISCRFVERFFLEALLQKNDKELQNLLSEYKVDIRLKGLKPGNTLSKPALEEGIRFIKSTDRLIVMKDSLYRTISWHDEWQQVDLRFPATFSLISGMDKKEADDLFDKEIKQMKAVRIPQTPVVVEETDLEAIDGGLYVKNGQSWFIKGLNNHLYFQKEDSNSFVLIHSEKYLRESIYNYFLLPNKLCYDTRINVNHRIYGNNQRQYTVSMGHIMNHLQDDFDKLLAVEQCDEKEIRLFIIFRSRDYNCHHLLHIQTTKECILEQKGEMNATLYTYIPHHNIKNLYEEF